MLEKGLLAQRFNSNISEWNVSNVKSLEGTFWYAETFNSDISKWQTSQVTTLENTFKFAKNFNSDISKWQTGQVITMVETFKSANKFNSDITKWDATNIVYTNLMFQDAITFNKTWCNPNWDGKITAGDFIGSKGMMKCCGAGQFNQQQATSPYIVCTDCSAGQFTSEFNANLSCKDCPKGWFQDAGKRQFCFPCEPGKKTTNKCFSIHVKKVVITTYQTKCSLILFLHSPPPITNQAPTKTNRDKHPATIAQLEHLWQMPNHPMVLVNRAIPGIIKMNHLDRNAKHVYPANGTIKMA